MQCYEGLDESKALYEWKYGKQLLYTQILKDKIGEVLGGTETLAEAVSKLHDFGDVFFSEEFVEPRPLLQALEQPDGCVLLIDEVDKADDEFEAFLLEVLSDYQVSIPEIGTIVAKMTPIVILTSNNVRDLGDALKRRCLHLHIPLPEPKLEERIIATRVPGDRDQPAQADRCLRPRAAHARPEQAAVDLGDHRLGPRDAVAARRPSTPISCATPSTCC